MGLMISELLSGAAPGSGGALAPARPNETVPGGAGGNDEFASRLSAMLQQLRNNASQNAEATQRQELATDTAGGDAAGEACGLVADAAVAEVPTGPAKPGKPVLGALILGPTLNVIQPVQQVPDPQSLMAFARSQGLDDRAIQWLLGPAVPADPDASEVTQPGDGEAVAPLDSAAGIAAAGHATATMLASPTAAAQVEGLSGTDLTEDAQTANMATDAQAVTAPNDASPADLQALAAQVMELLRQWLSRPTVPQPSAQTTELPSSELLFVLNKPLAASATESVDPMGSIQAAVASPTQGVPLTDAMRAALGAATQIVTAQTEGDALPLQTQASGAATPQLAPTTPQSPSPTPDDALKDVRQALIALMAALSNATESSTAATTSWAGRGATPAQTESQVLGHQAMVFVRAATRLQTSLAQAAANAPAAAKAKPPAPVRTVEIDLTEAWIGDDPTSATQERTRAQRQAVLRDAASAPLSTARALASRPHATVQGQEAAFAPLPSAAAAVSAPADTTHPAALIAGADRAVPSHALLLQTLEDPSRQRAAQSVNAAAPGSDPGGYKPQDPHRGQALAERMGEAVAQRLLQAVDRGEWSVKLALKPANLGHVEVQMRMHAGGLDAQFQASQSLTRDLLSDGLQRLRDSLTQMGMDVAQLNVGGGRSQQRGGDSTPRQTATVKAAGVETTEETDATNQPILSRPQRASGWDMLV